METKKEVEDKIKDILNEYVKKEHPPLFQIIIDYKTDNRNGIDNKLNLKDANVAEVIKVELIDHKFYI